ncbi:MAG: Peptidase [Bacteroidetes bacterium]|nr:Peptidase [Bacteroidota bacterium]
MFRTRYFAVSRSRLDYKEIRFFRTKLFWSSILMSAAVLAIALVANHFSHDLLGLGYNRMAMLDTENRVLKNQLKDLSEKFASVQQSIEGLADKGNELRLKVDMPRIDDETGSAAVGGAKQVSDFSFMSVEAGEVLTNAHTLIDQLSREVKLQQSSYEDISNRYRHNQAFFEHLPAIKPMDGYYSVNGYGMRIHPVLGVYRMHEGVDIINDVGTAVFAAADGIVRYAGRTEGGYGSVIDIVHGYGYSTLYAHLSRLLVRPGQAVKRGEFIAKSGRSGLVSGPHLHYEIRKNGRKQNPIDFFFDDVDAARYRSQVAAVKKPS